MTISICVASICDTARSFKRVQDEEVKIVDKTLSWPTGEVWDKTDSHMSADNK